MVSHIIKNVVQALCADVVSLEATVPDWKSLSEMDLLQDAVICIVGSQMEFELAIAITERLRKTGFLELPDNYFQAEQYEQQVANVLSSAVEVSLGNGSKRWMRPRFRNRIARLLTNNMRDFYGSGLSLGATLASAGSAKEARFLLTKKISGLGPKQSSLFLRRIGYSSELAVLDVHVLDYMRLAEGISLTANSLSRLPMYEKAEEDFLDVARQFGFSAGCVDLSMWVTMRVAKKESWLWDS